MSLNRIFLFGVLFLVIGALAVFYQAGAVSAFPIAEQNLDESVSNRGEIDIQGLEPANLETKKEKSVAQDEVELSAREVFDQLNQKALAAARSGWLYGREHRMYDVDTMNFGVHPNGQTIPLKEENNFWFYHNEEGFVEQSITIVQDISGQIIEVGVNSGWSSWSTATDEIVPHEMFSWGYGFDYGLHYYLDKPDLKWSNMSDENGNPVTAFTISVREDIPAVVEEYSSPILAVDHYYYFFTDTGFLTRTYSIAHLGNGSQRVFEDIQVEFSIGVTPPPEVLAYFEQKLEREGEK